MTSIVNFEERMKTTEGISNTIFDFLNLIEESKRSSVLPADLLSKTIILEGKLMANQVRKGKKTEEEAETFKDNIPNGKYPCFSFTHKDLDFAYNIVDEDINAALLEREHFVSKSQSVKKI